MSTDDSLPRDADGFYRMWIIRYVADGRTEEIHIPAYGEPDEHRLVRRRAKEIAGRHGTIVLYADGTTSANVNTDQIHPVHGRPQWMAVNPPLPYEVVECPNLERDHRP